jgi:hypothetical protein
MNGRMNLYETWYVYHGTRANLNGVLFELHQSVFCMRAPLSLLGNGSVGTALSSLCKVYAKSVALATSSHNTTIDA